MKIYKDLTTMSSPDYLLRNDNGKLLFKGSKSECKEEMEAMELNNKIAKEYGLFDEWMGELIEKNGVTKY
jgi:hypothetical protein